MTQTARLASEKRLADQAAQNAKNTAIRVARQKANRKLIEVKRAPYLTVYQTSNVKLTT
jgi:hypothetical protein